MSADRGHEREPAHDPARDVRAQEGVPGRAAVDVGHAAEHRPVAPDLPRRILAANDRGREVASRRHGGRAVEPGQADHARRGGEGLAERAVAVGHRRDPGRGPRGQAREPAGEARSGEAVRFREQEIEPDGGGARRRGRDRRAAARSWRGQGHWPYRARLGSSTATMTAGPEIRTRGASRWQKSNQSPRSRASGPQTSRRTMRATRASAADRSARAPQARDARPGAGRAVGRPGTASSLRRARRQPPRGRGRPPRPSDAELEAVVRGRDAEGALTPGQLLEALASPARWPSASRRRTPARDGRGTGAGRPPSGTARRPRCCSSGPSPP